MFRERVHRLTVYTLFEDTSLLDALANTLALPKAKNTVANNKKLDAISAFLEEQSTPESEFVPMGEVDWDFVRPLLEEVVLATYERDAVPVIEEIDARVNRGKGAAPEPPASPAENGHAALPEGESALEVVTPA